MALKQPHKCRWNGSKRQKDGSNTDRDMAYSTKGETTVFEIQTRDVPFPPKRALELSLTFQVARYIKLVREGFEQLKRSFGSVFLFLSYKNSQGENPAPRPSIIH